MIQPSAAPPAPAGGPPRLWGGPPWAGAPWGAGRLPWASSAAVAVVQLVGSHFASENQTGHVRLDLLARALLLAGPVLLLLRLRLPTLAALGTSAVVLAYLSLGYAPGPVFLSAVLAAGSAVIAGHRHAAWVSLGALWAGQVLLGHGLHRWLPPEGDGPHAWQQDAALAAWTAALLAVSELIRSRREQWAKDRAAREEAERRRADEERLRIARELHDVLAHSISVINVQAGMGLALLDSDPGQARAALTTIKAASKEALGEVRQVLDALRTPGGAAPLAPAPGLARLPELTEQAARAGLAVTTATEGDPVALPPGADLAAFRIVQEALTNVVRHSGSRAARVLLRYAPGGLDLRIDDDGPATHAPTGGGNGLLGMRERAAACGGTATAGPLPEGGYRVSAHLPARPAAPAPAPEPERDRDRTPRRKGDSP
ncbi:histidine kinase [Streptomyces sp. DSM 44917]|uniref:histidine kinase n=1 Tax=Streptomyces boetiae TaxID=3075541 RepID=A0ABU2LEC0_9ACTN|nr:histidine kinase [Streptomyces sp. DSM 44917]MDT0309940.1 histidine kinase [Streptomyces sp. DSM 44917]